MKKLGIIICDRWRRCAGGKCLRALRDREGAFSRYRGEEVELVGYTTCDGCPGGNVEYAPAEMKKNGAELALGLRVDDQGRAQGAVETPVAEVDGAVMCVSVSATSQPLAASGGRRRWHQELVRVDQTVAPDPAAVQHQHVAKQGQRLDAVQPEAGHPHVLTEVPVGLREVLRARASSTRSGRRQLTPS